MSQHWCGGVMNPRRQAISIPSAVSYARPFRPTATFEQVPENHRGTELF
jgi:hypothetical protein